MELACTKKLLDYLGMKAEKVSEDIDPLFAWTANLLLINRRKTLVVVNVASRSLFVIHGITVKMLPKMPELILQGIRAMLESEYVRSEVIERYLDDCGRDVIFRANASRSDVAYCNKGCAWVQIFSDLFVPGDLFQKQLLPCLNDDLSPNRQGTFVHEALIKALQAKYGDDIQSCRVAELEVSLKLHTPCKRVIRVPDDLNLYQLHRVLQDSFEWRDYHLHHFVTKRDQYERPVEIFQPINEMEDLGDLYEITRQDSTAVTVGELFRVYPQVTYEYDFGDNWQHTIKIRQFIDDCPQTWPHCIQAIGDAPMEDCGGINGFAEVMAILSNPNHPDHREISIWARSLWWAPLNVDRINRRIRNTHRRSTPVL